MVGYVVIVSPFGSSHHSAPFRRNPTPAILCHGSIETSREVGLDVRVYVRSDRNNVLHGPIAVTPV